MAPAKRPTDLQQKKRHHQHREELTPAPEQTRVLSPQDDYLLYGPQGIFGQGRADYQLARMADPTLAEGERHFLAGQIGQVQGNMHLQRMIAAHSSAATGLPNRPANGNGAQPPIARQPEPTSEETDGLGASGPPTVAPAGEPPPDDRPIVKRKSKIENRIQPKLTVNAPGDIYEQEADQVADVVMRMPAPAKPEDKEGSTPSPPPATVRGAPEDPSLTNLQMLRLKEEAELDEAVAATTRQTPESDQSIVNRKSEMPDNAGQALENPAVTPDTESSIKSMQGRGQPLPDSEREFFESRMGQDFSQVRLHTDSQAVQTSQDLNARAFTTGSDIAFGEGEYRPGTDEGRRLMAHELTHVVQQNSDSNDLPVVEASIQRDRDENLVVGSEEFLKQFEKDEKGRYILTGKILFDVLQDCYETHLKSESRFAANIVQTMGTLDTDFHYHIGKNPILNEKYRFVFEGEEFSASEVNYMGVGMGFEHFYTLSSRPGDMDFFVQAWNLGIHGHPATIGEHFWTHFGKWAYKQFFETNDSNTAITAVAPSEDLPQSNAPSEAPGGQPEPGVLQTKLTVNEDGDVYEQEADKIADVVMRMPALAEPKDKDSSTPPTTVQRLPGVVSDYVFNPAPPINYSGAAVQMREGEPEPVAPWEDLPQSKAPAASDSGSSATQQQAGELAPPWQDHLQSKASETPRGKQQEKPTGELRVNFQFGAQQFDNVSFIKAVQLVRTYVNSEKKSCDKLQTINKQWNNIIQATISEFLGGVDLPSAEQWQQPLDTLQAAVFAYRMGDLDQGQKNLEKARDQYNEVHKIWYQYREGISAGGESATTLMKLTITVLAAAATSGASLGVQATAMATITATNVASEELTVESEVDIGEILSKSAASFVKTLIGGPLAARFQAKLASKVFGDLPQDLVSVYGSKLIKELSTFLSNTATSWIEPYFQQTAESLKGKDFNFDQFADELIKQLKEDGFTQAFQAFLTGKNG